MIQTMHGLDEAAASTQSLPSGYSGKYVELFYNKESGEVWIKYQVSLGANSWTEYDDPNIVKTCNLFAPTTAQEISDLITMCVN